MQTLIGRKVGMTRVYDENGAQVPVTVVQVGPCAVVQRKTKETDGYERGREAVGISFGNGDARTTDDLRERFDRRRDDRQGHCHCLKYLQWRPIKAECAQRRME